MAVVGEMGALRMWGKATMGMGWEGAEVMVKGVTGWAREVGLERETAAVEGVVGTELQPGLVGTGGQAW